MPSIKQNTDGSLGIQGSQLDDGGFLTASFVYDSNLDGKVFFVAPRPYHVKAIYLRPTVAGVDAGTVSVTVKKAANAGTMDSLATALHTSTLNLKGTINTNQAATLATGSTAQIAAGSAIGLDLTGTPTSAAGVVTVLLAPR